LARLKLWQKNCSLTVIPCFILVPEDVTTVQNLDHYYTGIKAIEDRGIKPNQKITFTETFPVIVLKTQEHLKALLGL